VGVFAYSFTIVFAPIYFGLNQSINAILEIKYFNFYIDFCNTKNICNKFITSAKMHVKMTAKVLVNYI